MDITLYITFLLVSFGLIIIPGPNVLVIISTSISHGKKRGLQTVAGTSFAMAIQLLVVALSTSWFIQSVSNGIFYLKWIGVVYLLYLGILHFKYAIFTSKQDKEITSSATFLQGFIVSITNPKTLLFFSAFLPQFVSSPESYSSQILLLSMSFLILAIILDSCYALLSAKLAVLAKDSFTNKLQHGFSSLLFLGASAWLAAMNRTP